MSNGSRPKVVIVGAGFGGLHAVRALRKADVDLILVDQHNHQCFTPLIYQVATAMLEPSEIAHPIRTHLRKHPHADFRLGRVTEVDLEARMVKTDQGSVPYDYLILGTGSTNNYFKHPEIAEIAFGLNDVGEAVALRNHLLSRFEHAAWTNDPAERQRLLTFVMVGGGPTGVEFAGSMSELVYGILHKDFPTLDLNEVSIHLIEGSDAPLPPFHEKLQGAAAKALERRHVKITCGIVENVTEDGVKLADGTSVPTGTVIWAAGVRAEHTGERLGVELGTQRRVPVSATLQLEGHPEVLVCGDLAEMQQDGGPLPMLAPVAMQSGTHAGRTIKDLIAGREPKPFRYKALPTMATIGRGDAVVQHKNFKAKGMMGWLLWVAVHVLRLAGVRARVALLMDWFTAFLFRDRPMRLIIRPLRPDLDRK